MLMNLCNFDTLALDKKMNDNNNINSNILNMIKINYRNLLVKPDPKKYTAKLSEIQKMPLPSFESEKPDLEYLAREAKKYRKYKNVILIGNGGSRTSSLAFYHSLGAFRNNIQFEFITSPEPEVIKNIRKRFSKKDTLVLVISKSGGNINSIEPLLALSDYPVLVITGEKDNPLRKIASAKKWPIIIHPEVGGRFSGMTSCGLFPAALMGLDIKKIYAGAKDGYRKYDPKANQEKNSALKLALYFSELEQKKYTEIFTGVYSTSLFGFFPLIVQLIHESTGKDGKGQTIFGDQSPESQHHTNQRFFGGRSNAVGLFMGVDKQKNDFQLKVPQALSKIMFEGNPLSRLDGLQASQTLHFDLEGVVTNAISKKIPVVKMMISEITPEIMGEFMVFWQYFAVYSALLRNQNPFNQPEVEDSKKISLKLRMKR